VRRRLGDSLDLSLAAQRSLPGNAGESTSTMYATSTVVQVDRLTSEHVRINLHMPGGFEGRPGQFVMVRSWNTYDPLLPRPFSIHRFLDSGDGFELLIKIRGRGTEYLASLKPGDSVEILGPLGNGFDIPARARRIALVARGIGVAPMLALAEDAIQKGVEVFTFLSARSRDSLVCADELQSLSASAYVLTDDQPEASGRLVTDQLVEAAALHGIDAVYVCGSNRLTRAVAQLAVESGIPGYVSLESAMACGVGWCKGCVCKTYEPNKEARYSCVCSDGPVFDVRQVRV